MFLGMVRTQNVFLVLFVLVDKWTKCQPRLSTSRNGTTNHISSQVKEKSKKKVKEKKEKEKPKPSTKALLLPLCFRKGLKNDTYCTVHYYHSGYFIAKKPLT